MLFRRICTQLIKVNYGRYSTTFYKQPCYQFAKIGKKEQDRQDKKSEKEKLNLDETIDVTIIEGKFKDFMLKLREQLSKLKVGRLQPEMLDSIQILAYGQRQNMSSFATISTKAANVVQLSVFDESVITDILKSLENSSLNLQIKRDGKIIICTQVGGNTKEQKGLVVVKAKQQIEAAKLSIRKIRQEALEYVKPYKKISSEDTTKRAEKEIQVSYDKFIEELDLLMKNKEKEIMNS